MPRYSIDVVADISKIKQELKNLSLDSIKVPLNIDTSKLAAAASQAVDKVAGSFKDKFTTQLTSAFREVRDRVKARDVGGSLGAIVEAQARTATALSAARKASVVAANPLGFALDTAKAAKSAPVKFVKGVVTSVIADQLEDAIGEGFSKQIAGDIVRHIGIHDQVKSFQKHLIKAVIGEAPKPMPYPFGNIRPGSVTDTLGESSVVFRNPHVLGGYLFNGNNATAAGTRRKPTGLDRLRPGTYFGMQEAGVQNVAATRSIINPSVSDDDYQRRLKTLVKTQNEAEANSAIKRFAKRGKGPEAALRGLMFPDEATIDFQQRAVDKIGVGKGPTKENLKFTESLTYRLANEAGDFQTRITTGLKRIAGTFGQLTGAVERVAEIKIDQIVTNQAPLHTARLTRNFSRLDDHNAVAALKSGNVRAAEELLPLVGEIQKGNKTLYVLLDGNHRVQRAVLEGQKTILVRLTEARKIDMRGAPALLRGGMGFEGGVSAVGGKAADAGAALREAIEKALGPETIAEIRKAFDELGVHIQKEFRKVFAEIAVDASKALKGVGTVIAEEAAAAARSGIGKAAVGIIEKSREVGAALKVLLAGGTGVLVAGVAVGFERIKTIFQGLVAGSRILSFIGASTGTIAIGVAKATSGFVEFIDKIKSIPSLPFKAIGEAFSGGLKGATGGIAEKITAGLKAATLKSADVIEPLTKAGAATLRFGAGFLRVLGIVTGFWATLGVLAIQGVEVVTRSTRAMATELLRLRSASGLGIEVINEFKESLSSAGLEITSLTDLHEQLVDRINERRREGQSDFVNEGAPKTAGLTATRAADLGLGPLLTQIKDLDESGDKVAAFTLAIKEFGVQADTAMKLARNLDLGGSTAPSPEAIAAVDALTKKWADFKKQLNEFLTISIFSTIKNKIVDIATSFGDSIVTNMGRALGALELITAEVGRINAGMKNSRFTVQGLVERLPKFPELAQRAQNVGNQGPFSVFGVPLQGLNVARAIQDRSTSNQEKRATELQQTQESNKPLTDEQTKALIEETKRASVDLFTPEQKIRDAAKEKIRTYGEQIRRNAKATGADEADAERAVAGYVKQINDKRDLDLAALVKPEKAAARTPAATEDRDTTFKAQQRLEAGDAKRYLDQLKEVGATRLSALEKLHAAELIGESEFAAERKQIRDEVFNAEEKELEREVARRKSAIESPGLKDEQRIDAVNAYRQAIADLATHQASYQKEAQDDWLDQLISLKKLKDEVEDLRDELDRAGASEGLTNFLRVMDQQKKVRESIARELDTGTDPRRETVLLQKREQLDRQLDRAQLGGVTTDAQAGISRTTESLSRTEQQLDLTRKAGAISEFELLNQLSAARKSAIADYEVYIAKIEAANSVLKDPKVTDALAGMRLEVQKLAASADLLRDKFATALEEGIGGTLEKLTTGQIHSFKDLIKSFSDDIFRSINSVVVKGLTTGLAGKDGPLGGIASSLASLFGGSKAGTQAPAPVTTLDPAAALGIGKAAETVAEKGAEAAASTAATAALANLTLAAIAAEIALKAVAASAGEGGVEKLLAKAAGAAAGAEVDHAGGIVGGAGRSRVVSMAAFARAPRYHLGGIAGNEVPVIAQRGEGIFTPQQMAHLAPVGGSGSGGGGTLYLTQKFTLEQPADRRTQTQIAHQAGMGVQRAMKRNG